MLPHAVLHLLIYFAFKYIIKFIILIKLTNTILHVFSI